MTLIAGTRLGTYEILGPLGAGGMGEVYRAKDLRLGRQIAIKMLPGEVASSPDRLARFEREARTVAGLNHPNIVTLFSVEDEDGIRFLTMELVEGQTLSNLVTPGGLPVSRVLELSIPLADALAAAHERGVIHRDLKPGNVMVTREDRVKVLDFGLAKVVDGVKPATREALATTIGSPISSEGEVRGTVPYMAPEQIRGESVDARADLFALGILLYELATGLRPFTGVTSADVSSSILRDVPKPLTRIRADLPADLERIVGRCLQKNPRDRAQSALDISNELRTLRGALERGALGTPACENVASIAVLPFVNRSRDEADEYFSDGLADELLNVLAKIKGLRVSARASSFHFKGKDVPLAEVGSALNVATVLDGSLRKAGNRVRISVQLVKVSDGYHMWSETYDRTLEDIFAVQDDIAQSVVKELRATLLGEGPDSEGSGQVKAEVARAARGRSTDPEAHRLYLQARHLIDRRRREDVAKGIEYLKQALEREPEFALAWAELSQAYSRESDSGWVPVAEGYRRAREAVERALSLEADLAEALTGMGRIRMKYDWDFRGAKAAFAKALEVAPGDALTLRWAGVLELALGRHEEAIGLYRLALEQDPLSAACYNSLGSALHSVERFAEAESAYRKAQELAPHAGFTHALLSEALIAQGRGREALAEALQESDEGFRLWALAIVHHVLGHGPESDYALRDLIQKLSEVAAFQIAEAYGARGEVEAAFQWLERAYAQRDSGLSDQLNPSLNLRTLHGDPRWDALLKKVGFG